MLTPLVSSAPSVPYLLRYLAIQGLKDLRHSLLAEVRPRQKHATLPIWGPAGEGEVEDYVSSYAEGSDIGESRWSRSKFPRLPSPCRTVSLARVKGWDVFRTTTNPADSLEDVVRALH